MKTVSCILLGITVWIFLMTFDCWTVLGEDGQPHYDLSQCIAIALKNHPSLLSSEYMVKFHESGLDIQRSQFGPQLSFHGGVVQFESEHVTSVLLPSLGESSLATKGTSGTNYIAGVTLSQPVFTEASFFGVSAPGIEREKSKITEGVYTSAMTREDVIYDVITAYGNVLKASRSLQIAENVLKTDEALVAAALSKFNSEIISRSDYLEAESIFAEQKAQVERSRSYLDITMTSLSNKMGDTMRISGISSDMERFKGILCDREHAYPTQELVEIASQKRNDIRAKEAKIQSILNNIGVTKSTRYPTLNLDASYYHVEENGFSSPGNAWNVLLRIDMTLFDFGKTSALISQQQNLLSSERETLRSLKNTVALQIQDDRQRILSLRATLASLQKSVEAKREALAQAKEKYGKNIIAEVEMLQAQDKLAQAEGALFETEVDLVISNVALTYHIGYPILECSRQP